MGLLMNSIVQIFCKEHISLFTFYIVFIIGKYFILAPELICFWERIFGAKQGPPLGAQLALSPRAFPGALWTPAHHSGSLIHWNLNYKSAVGEEMSLKSTHSDPLTWEEICRWLLEAFSTLQIVLKSIGYFFFSWNTLCSILPGSWGLS